MTYDNNDLIIIMTYDEKYKSKTKNTLDYLCPLDIRRCILEKAF